eukprot:CAMPEP_0179856956 /NCGR_PEP_ID=MMETSP0982-20121206/11479_1 /TAXON_ID=483367 /ORGANISM="non described non described, Strain CCMP 2436" /LENGTH=34 /DNA_ID= /DNA_START= /DNA_END= /DNA_ORIENTATION=
MSAAASQDGARQRCRRTFITRCTARICHPARKEA